MKALSAIGEHLSEASSAQDVWRRALEDVTHALNVENGAWVWKTPTSQTMPLDSDRPSNVSSWHELVDEVNLFPEKYVDLPVISLSSEAILIPVTAEPWSGWLALRRAETEFTQKEIDFAVSVVQMARLATLSWIRYQHVNMMRARQVQELAALQQMGRAIASSLDLETTLHVVLESLLTLLSYDAGEITLFDVEQNVLVSQAFYASDEAQHGVEKGTVYQLNEGLTGWLARNRCPLLLTSAQDFSHMQPKNVSFVSWARSFLGVPLLARGELIGTLEIASALPEQFSEHDLELTELFGGQAAVAIENARLYQASQKRLSTLERLREIVRTIAKADDPNMFFKDVAECVANIVNAEIAGVLLYEDSKQGFVAHAPFMGIPDEWVDNYIIPLQKHSMWEQDRFYWSTEDAQSDPQVEALGLSPLAVAVDVHQALLVALETGDELIGFIQVANPKDHRRFTEEDTRILTMLASQISGMVHISQLVERMARRTQQLGSLVSVASTIGATLDLEAVLKEILQAVSNVLHCQHTVIFELDSFSNQLNLVAAEGISERYWELSQGIPVTRGGRGHAVAANEMVFSADVWEEPETFAIAPLAKEEGFRAFVDLPLRRGDQPVGLLSVQFVDAHHFSNDELNLLRILAEQAAVAIENARLYTQTDAALRRRLDAMEVLQRVTREITATVDLDHILDEVLGEAIRFCGGDAGLIALFDEQDVELRVFQGYAEEDLRHLRALSSDSKPGSPLYNFVERQELVNIADVQKLSNAAVYPPEARSLLMAPVFYEQRLVAALLIQSHRPNTFGKAEKEFVEGLAVQTAIAIGNTQRYQEQLRRGELIHQRAEQMSLLLEVGRTMRSDRDLEDILLDVAYAVQEGTGFNIVLISVLEGSYLRRVAGAGIPLVELQRMKSIRHAWARIKSLFQERFRLGQCYYIPAEYAHLLEGIDIFVPEAEDVGRQPGMWHKLDSFLIPLRGSRGDIVGLMSVDKPLNERAPTDATAEVIELFAAQVALAIENNRLVQDLRRQVDTLQLFNELNRSITTKLDLSLVLNTVVQAVTNLLGYDYATIYLKDKRELIPLASSGYSLDLLGDISFEVGRGLVGTVAQMGMPLVIDDTQSDPRFVPIGIPIGSSILVPLMVEGHSVGVISADRKRLGDFSPTDIATLTSLADQVAVAVENARLFDEVKRFNEELEERVAARTQELAEALEDLRVQRDRSEVLYHIASELVASLDMDHMLSRALLLLQKAVKASKSAVILLDNSGQLIYRAAIGHTTPIPPGGRVAPFAPDQGLVGHVLSHKEPLMVADIHESELELPTRDVSLIRSILAVPILGGNGESLGVILLQSPIVGAFDRVSLQLVEAAAVQLGNALNNAELYHLIQEQAERLGAMLRTQQIEAVKNEAILEGIADGVMVADANGRVILFNAAAERILSITRTQALGRFQDDILGLYGSAAREWLAQIEQWQKTPEAYGSDEFLAHRLEVGRKVVSVHLSPVMSSGREFLGVVSVFRDITSEVEADRAKSDFVSTVSHELRTPMTSIVGYVDLLVGGAIGPLSNMQLDFLKKVKSNADRLTSLVNDLLDISRIETGRIELQCAPVAIEDLIHQVLDLLHPKVEEKGQRLEAVLPFELPKVYGDATRLTQILTNLIGNAHKYTPTGGEVKVYAYVRDQLMHVAVADTGIGIAKENQQKIFDRFYRVEDDPAVYEVSGTGLGLAISLSLIQMHSGDIWLDSELGVGSIFTFSLPLAEGEPTQDVGDIPPSFAQQEPMATVMIVENDLEFAGLLKSVLESEGMKVLIVTSGEQALRLAREQLPDLISLDVRLPDLDGFEVLQLLKRESTTADIPVIVLSAVQEQERGLQLGAVEYLTKPIEAEKFFEAVFHILERRGPVLVAGDDRQTLDRMRSALQAQGVGVHTTRLGQVAFDLVDELHPAVMLLDLPLRDMSNAQVLEQLGDKSAEAQVSVIVTSHRSMVGVQEHVAASGNVGVFQFLTKPFSVEGLVKDITHLVNGNGKHKES